MRRALPALLVVAATASCLAYAAGASASATKRLVSLAAAALVLSVSLTDGARRHVGVNPAWLAGLGFVAWSALGAAWGAEGALLGLAVPLAALAFGSVSAALGVEAARRVATLAALAVGFVLASLVLASWCAGERGFSLHAGQGNPNWAGLVLAVALPLAVSDPLLSSWSERTRRSVRFGCGVVMGLSIAATESRTALLSALAGVLVLTLGNLHGRRRTAAVTLVAMAICGGFVSCALALRPAAPVGDFERALQGRLWIHELTLRAARDHLPWGAGLGRFHETFLSQQGRELAELTPSEAARRFENATSAHQEFLEVTLEGGPVALLLFGCALLIALRGHYRSGFHAGAAALAGFGAGSLADSPWRETPLPILLALVFAALPGATAPEASRTRHGVRLLYLGLLASTGALLPSAVGAFAASRARSAAREAEPERRLELLRHAANLAPADGGIALELGAARLELGDAEGAVRDLRRAERLAPDPASAVALGNALVVRADFDAARQAYERAVALHPGSFRARVGLAEALRRLGDFDLAETHASTAAALLPGDTRARELLDRIREERADSTLGVTPRD